MKICSVHKTPSVWKEGTSKKTGNPYAFWACTEKNGDDYCQAEQIDVADSHPIEPPKETQVGSGVAPTEKVDWDAKDRQSMAQTAMKSASEIIAAMIHATSETEAWTINEATLRAKEMANEFFLELKRMKSNAAS